MNTFLVVWILVASQNIGNGRMLCTYDNQRGQQITQVQVAHFCNPNGPQ